MLLHVTQFGQIVTHQQYSAAQYYGSNKTLLLFLSPLILVSGHLLLYTMAAALTNIGASFNTEIALFGLEKVT